jgi:RNA polymerase sigma factor (sigma-70 family)
MHDITGIKQGDAGSFREAYDQFHARIFRYFFKRTSLHETATELTQQFFIKLWQSRHTLSPACSLEIQLFTMANSVWIDHLRHEAVNRKHYSTVADLEPLMGDHADQPAFHAVEAGDGLKQAVSKLPPVRRKIFILKMLYGFSNREIAGRLSVSVKTVEDHLWKAMRVVRSMMSMLWSIVYFLWP